MTEVAFHFNAPDKWAYACRLLRKATHAGARVVVVAEEEGLSHLDSLLWTFSPLEFVPHCLWPGQAQDLQASPVVLSDALERGLLETHHQVLVNLGGAVPAGFESFERVIEVVTLDDTDRQAARGRWKHYADRGYTITRHDLKLKPEST
jgi:DNA polymerase-3 subunit chi